MTPSPLRVFGTGKRAELLVDFINWQLSDRYLIEGYYCDRLPVGTLGPGGHPILGTVTEGLHRPPKCDLFVALGTLKAAIAWRAFTVLRAAGVRFASFVSPDAHISPSATIGANAFVMPGVVVGRAVNIGEMFIAHGNATVEHDSSIGDQVLLGPGVVLGGGAHIGSHCFIGAGASVRPSVRIGIGSILGTGAVAATHIEAHKVAIGVPALAIRSVREGDEAPLAEQIRDFNG